MFFNKKLRKQEAQKDPTLQRAVAIRQQMKQRKEATLKRQFKANLEIVDRIKLDIQFRRCKFVPSAAFQRHLGFVPIHSPHAPPINQNGNTNGSLLRSDLRNSEFYINNEEEEGSNADFDQGTEDFGPMSGELRCDKKKTTRIEEKTRTGGTKSKRARGG